jgi:hypothetical protein
VPAGGLSSSATLRELARARSAAAAASGAGPGWFANSLLPLESTEGGSGTLIASNDWKLRDAQGFAVRSSQETGDWHMFSPASIAAGQAAGYGQWGAQAENGGRFFTTSAMVWEAASSAQAGPAGSSAAPLYGPYSEMAAQWLRVVQALGSISEQLQAGDTSQPLLASDRAFLAKPVQDALVLQLCEAVRQKAGFPNVTDAWGSRLCNYYQDVCWGTPESGILLFSFVRGMLGLHVAAGGSVGLLGAQSPPWAAGSPSWQASSALPSGWPEEVQQLQVLGLAAGSLPLRVACSAGSGQLSCSVEVLQ